MYGLCLKPNLNKPVKKTFLNQSEKSEYGLDFRKY